MIRHCTWLLPVIESVQALKFLRRSLLRIRWVAVGAVLLTAYVFERAIGGSYTLVNMGIISFAAVLQFAPAIVGGLYWRRGSRAGAILGLADDACEISIADDGDKTGNAACAILSQFQEFCGRHLRSHDAAMQHGRQGLVVDETGVRKDFVRNVDPLHGIAGEGASGR